MTRKSMLCAGLAALLSAGSFQAIRSTSEYRAAVASYLASHPVCEHSANTAVVHSSHVVVHHRIPVHIAPWRAADTNNMITLCDPPDRTNGCHYRCGHPGGWYCYSRKPGKCRRKP